MDQRFAMLCELLGENVRLLRKNMGISQEELAFMAELDRTYISQIERGISNPSLFVLLKIASVLNLQIADLFEGATIKKHKK